MNVTIRGDVPQDIPLFLTVRGFAADRANATVNPMLMEDLK